jgi:hypothetical protein
MADGAEVQWCTPAVACMMSHCGSLRNIKHSLCGSRQRSQQQCRPYSRQSRRAMAQVHADGLSAEEVGTGIKPTTRATWRSSKCTSTRFTRIAVFCGASEGTSPIYMEAAQASLMLSCRHTLRWRIAVSAHDQMTHDKTVRSWKLAPLCGFAMVQSGRADGQACGVQALGEELARRGLGLVYGGGSVGLMGKLASTVSLIRSNDLRSARSQCHRCV